VAIIARPAYPSLTRDRITQYIHLQNDADMSFTGFECAVFIQTVFKRLNIVPHYACSPLSIPYKNSILMRINHQRHAIIQQRTFCQSHCAINTCLQPKLSSAGHISSIIAFSFLEFDSSVVPSLPGGGRSIGFSFLIQ
jgi:hypothetical protein